MEREDVIMWLSVLPPKRAFFPSDGIIVMVKICKNAVGEPHSLADVLRGLEGRVST